MKNRARQKELMDGPLEDPKVLYKNLREIQLINRLTSFYSQQFKQIKKLIPEGQEKTEVIDIACGGGDFLQYLNRNRHKIPSEIILAGLDSEIHAIEFSKRQYPELKKHVNWLNMDYKTWLQNQDRTDIICCNLFCHHLSDEEIIDFLKKAQKKARLGILINDLHRHPLAYYTIKFLTKVFSGSEYTRNDAPLSVLRSFTRKDWVNLISQSSEKRDKWGWDIKWLPSFRFLICGKNAFPINQNTNRDTFGED